MFFFNGGKVAISRSILSACLRWSDPESAFSWLWIAAWPNLHTCMLLTLVFPMPGAPVSVHSAGIAATRLVLGYSKSPLPCRSSVSANFPLRLMLYLVPASTRIFLFSCLRTRPFRSYITWASLIPFPGIAASLNFFPKTPPAAFGSSRVKPSTLSDSHLPEYAVTASYGFML